MGRERGVLPANLYFRYDGLFPVALGDVSPLVRQVRAVKSEYEIELIRRAALMIDTVARSVAECLEEGITEIEFAGRLEAVARREGHPGLVRVRRFNQETFYGHLMAGPSAAVPTYMDAPLGGWGATPAYPQGAGWRRIGRGEPVVLDYGGCVEGYIADQTRIFSLGPLPDDLMAAYRAMRAIHDEVAAAARPGVACGELYELAARRAAEMGYGAHFGGYGENQVSFVGHCLGLELDETPVLARGVTTPLEEGMVFALEPKAVFPGRGVVGLENTFVVRGDGVEKLTVSDEDVVVVRLGSTAPTVPVASAGTPLAAAP